MGAGRPVNSYKYKDLITGEPISAIEFHKQEKELEKKGISIGHPKNFGVESSIKDICDEIKRLTELIKQKREDF